MIIIRNAVVYANNPAKQVFWNATIVIDGHLIKEVCDDDSLKPEYKSGAEFIDGKGKLAIPGLVDSHMHLDSAFLRGLIPPRWMGWLKTYFSWYFDLLDEDDFYYSSLFNIGKRLLTGTTSIVDAGPLPGFETPAVDSVKISGVRANLNRITMDVFEEALGENGFAQKHRETTDEALTRGREFIEKYNGSFGGRLKAGLCLMQVPTTSRELGQGARRIADEFDTTLHTHAGVHGELLEKTKKIHNMGDVEYFDSIGLLGPRLTAAHMGWISEDEINRVVRKHVNVAHCPTSTTINGKGILSKGNIVKMYKQGANISLGTDELDVTDLFRTMFAVLNHRDIWMDNTLFPLETILDMGTINGAKSMGESTTRLGTIEKGNFADIALIKLRNPDMVPFYKYSLLPNLITGACGNSVDTVLIHGKEVVRAGKVVTFDMEKVISEVQRRAARYVESAVNLGIHDKEARSTFAN